jgi:putative heme-binding domain-containing protein
VATAKALPLKKEAAQELAAPLLAAAERDGLPHGVRLDALAALPPRAAQVGDATFAFLVAQLDAGAPLARRMVAAEAVGRLKLTVGQSKQLTELLKVAGPLEIERMLPAFEVPVDDSVGLAVVASLRDARSLKSVRPDVIRRSLEKHPESVRAAADALLGELAPDAAKQRAHLEELMTTLPPGDVRRGQALFNSDRAACATCHAIGYLGGQLGPDLTRIGAVRQERDLLESIVFPSLSFVQSYEPVQLDTKSNERHYGILRRDDAQEVMLLTGPTEQTRVAREDVKSMRPGTLSVMPEGMDQILTKQELADLVAFLKACR